MHVLPFFVAHPIVPWIGDRPALGDLARVPSRRAFGMRGDDEMEVVGHHRVRQDIDRERAGLLAHRDVDPLAAVVPLVAAEEAPAHAAADEVVGTGAGLVDEM